MTSTSLVAMLCVFASTSWAAPATRYDQRQQGDLNIHAQLDNVMVVVIPSSSLNLLEYATDKKFLGKKDILQLLMEKLQNRDVEKNEVVEKGGNVLRDVSNDIPVLVTTISQQVGLNPYVNKDEEVVATVQKMKSDSLETHTELPTSEITEENLLKEHNTVSEIIKDTVLTVDMPNEYNHGTILVEQKVKAIEAETSPLPSLSNQEERLQKTSDTDNIDVEKSLVKETIEQFMSSKDSTIMKLDDPAPTTGTLTVSNTEENKLMMDDDILHDSESTETLVDKELLKPSKDGEDLLIRKSDEPSKENGLAVKMSNETFDKETKSEVSDDIRKETEENSNEKDVVNSSLASKVSSETKSDVLTKLSSEASDQSEPTIEDYIRPVAAKEVFSPESKSSSKPTPKEAAITEPHLQEGARKDKVIHYKPDTKWAPQLVDMLGPPKEKATDNQERQMFEELCSPGVWDQELDTCITPGETRRYL